MPPQRTHAVIGDGATAAGFAMHAPVVAGDRLLILGPNVAELGRGLAYHDHGPDAPWRYAYLLNSPNEMVHADFAAWFEQAWPQLLPDLQRTQPGWLAFGAAHIAARDYGALFAPRAIFGHWVREITTHHLAQLARRDVQIDLRPLRVTRITPEAGRFRLTCDSGDTLMADRVDLATGGAGNTAFSAEEAPGLFPALYGYEDRIARSVQEGDTVTCLGGNAAMLDVLRLLQSICDERQVKLRVIRPGKGPAPLQLSRPRRAKVQPQLDGRFATADRFLSALDAEMATFRRHGADMAELRAGVSAWFDAHSLDTLLPDKAEQRVVQGQLEARFRRGTHDSIADYERLKAAGQIEEIRGRVERVEATGPRGGCVTYSVDGQAKSVTAPIIINTSGPRDPLALDPLAHDLIRQGVLRPNPDRTGIALRAGLLSEWTGLRYLSPAVTEIGETVLPFPLYDVARLWATIEAAS